MREKTKIQACQEALKAYDTGKGFLKRFAHTRTKVANEIDIILNKTTNDSEKKETIRTYVKNHIDYVLNSSPKFYDFNLSQTAILLLKLDIILFNGKNFIKSLKQDPSITSESYLNDNHLLITFLSTINLTHALMPYMQNEKWFIDNVNLAENNNHQNTALMWTIMNNACDSAIALINHNQTDLTLHDNEQKNPLHMVLLKGREHQGDMKDQLARATHSGLTKSMSDVLNVLFDKIYLLDQTTKSKILNQPMNDGNTPLHIAYLRKDMQLAKRLIALGANEEIKNNNHQKPRDLLVMNESDVKAYLQEKCGVFTVKFKR